MNELKDILHELRCDIAAIPVTEDNKTEIDNANETLQRAWNKVLFLSGVIQRSEQFCECSNPKGEGNQAKCDNCGNTFKTY